MLKYLERDGISDIDLDSQASQRPLIFKSMKDVFGYHRVLNIATFKTEKTKSAILTACRGFDIDVDEAQAIASLVPEERGFLWPIKDCIYGSEEKGRKPVTELINELNKHPGLTETIIGIEGLVCGISSHASGVYVFNNHYLDHCSLMKTPSGQFITSYDMSDCDYCGGLKIDALTIEALDKIRQTMNLLLDFKLIEWQGTLKDTYNKYLHPDVIEYDDIEMWKLLHERQVLDVFQYETMTGTQALEQIKPTSVYELSAGNSIMRLMGDGDISPLEKYANQKNDIQLWYDEMAENGLIDTEIITLEQYLKISYGIAGEQEDVMQISMDEQITNFDVAEANKLRKAIAKKKAKDLAMVKELFYSKGESIGTSDNFLNYIWHYCIMPQAGLIA